MQIGRPLLLAALIIVSRWPLRTHYLYNWDAANFALATRSFDVVRHQPHPPGYPYFVGLGSLLLPLFADANAALVAVAVLLEVVAVLAVWQLGCRMFSPGAGLAAAVLLAASVTFWSYGLTALAYPALAAFSTLVALFAYQTLFEGRDRALWCAAAYAAGTGFRPDLALFLLPLLLATCLRVSPRRAAGCLAIAFGGIALWLVPVALLSGGINAYGEILMAYLGADVVDRYAPTARGLDALLVNVRDTLQYAYFGLYAAAPLVLMGGLLLLVKGAGPRALFLTTWMAPMALFYLLVHVGDPGYVFSFLPGLLLAGTGGWSLWLRGTGDRWRHASVLALLLVLAVNTGIFFLHPRPLTLPGIRAADAGQGARLEFIRSHPPGEVLLVSYDSYKHFRYYLPEYPHSVWLDTSTPKRQVFPVPEGVRYALLMDPSVSTLAQDLDAAGGPPAGGAWGGRVPVRPGQSLVYEDGRLQLQP